MDNGTNEWENCAIIDFRQIINILSGGGINRETPKEIFKGIMFYS